MRAEAKKHEYWNHFITKWALKHIGGGYGPTGKKATAAKLCKVKLIIWNDATFWDDILLRHDGMYITPERMQQERSDVYEHCLGNFWGMLMQSMVEHHILL